MATFYTGSTGGSTGPHLDFRVYNPSTGQYENPSGYISYLSQGDKPFNYQVTSGFGMRTHPIHGDRRMHHGIDYATPLDTPLTVNGRHLSTWEDKGGGGIMSQYLINTDDGDRELLLLHGSRKNAITGGGAVTDYKPFSSMTPPETPQKPDGTPISTGSLDLPEDSEPVPDGVLAHRSGAKAKAQAYADMSKSEINAAYDALRASDPAKAKIEGMKMHKAFFNK